MFTIAGSLRMVFARGGLLAQPRFTFADHPELGWRVSEKSG
jgi:hypothetical protein